MNCERCKNKKATVFYADDGGGQHALCVSCAETVGRLAAHPATASEAHGIGFLPPPVLLSMSCSEEDAPSCLISSGDTSEQPKCAYCSTTLDSLVARGSVGCPECYRVFEELLFPASPDSPLAVSARLPHKHRDRISRRNSVATMKKRLKLAVEAENYELAATLRDEIKKLELRS